MTRADINRAIEQFCQECHGPEIGCINQKCALWECRTVDLAQEQTIEVISDAVMFICQECVAYHGHCYDQNCPLAEIPT